MWRSLWLLRLLNRWGNCHDTLHTVCIDKMFYLLNLQNLCSCSSLTFCGVIMGTKLSPSIAGNSIPLFLSSWYTSTTPFKSGWLANVSAQTLIKVSTFSCTAAEELRGNRRNKISMKVNPVTIQIKNWDSLGGSYFGPISLTSSCMKSLLATSKWKCLPQFFTHVSTTVRVSLKENWKM